MISTNEIYNVLLLEFPYFKKINEEKRQLLCKRTKNFIEGTDFIPRKGMELTNRMMILISACSQQLTLAFPKHYDYTYFEKVIVYPEKYYSTYTEKYHTGEMNTAGIIVLSWEDFYKGIKIDNDTHNVGLHEFAHALEFMDIANKDIDETFSACFDKFTALADHYLQHQPDKPLFRSYATTNLSEFFAVATEYYFEAPNEFAEREPELFDVLNKAYQQNTAPNAKKVKPNTVSPLLTGALFFGEYVTNLNIIIEIGVYAILMVLSGYMYTEMPVFAFFFLTGSLFFCYKYWFKSNFSLFESDVQIHIPLIRNLVKTGFSEKLTMHIHVDYSNVLYVSTDELFSDKYDSNYERIRSGLKYTLCYWNQGRIEYAKLSTTKLNYDAVLRFLYVDKKVGTRLNGNYKKYR